MSSSIWLQDHKFNFQNFILNSLSLLFTIQFFFSLVAKQVSHNPSSPYMHLYTHTYTHTCMCVHTYTHTHTPLTSRQCFLVKKKQKSSLKVSGTFSPSCCFLPQFGGCDFTAAVRANVPLGCIQKHELIN